MFPSFSYIISIMYYWKYGFRVKKNKYLNTCVKYIFSCIYSVYSIASNSTRETIWSGTYCKWIFRRVPVRHTNFIWAFRSSAGTMASSTVPASISVELKRNFHILHTMTIVSTFIIGTGIYLGPTGVHQRITSPGLALIIWIMMGFSGMVDGLVYAEYATVFPRCGCAYLYLEIFYGPAIGFLQLWMYFLIYRPGSDAIKCLLAAT